MTDVGYFAWSSFNGKLVPEKFLITRKPNNVVRKWPLNETEWKFPLDTLVRMYPQPEVKES